MKGRVKRMLGYLATLVVCGIAAAAPGHAKEKAPSKLQVTTRTPAVKMQVRFIDLDGYRLVSPNSTKRCRQTLQSTLECSE